MSMKGIGAWLRAGWFIPRESESKTLRSGENSFLLEDTKRDHISDTQRNRKAVHESGHALIAWLSSAAKPIHINLEAEYGNGNVLFGLPNSMDNDTEFAWVRTVIDLAGLAAELRVFKNFRSVHSAGDLSLAREHAAFIEGSPRIVGRVYDSPRDYVPIFSQQIFRIPLDARERDLLNAAFTQAKYLFDSHEARFYRLVSRCMNQDFLNEHDIDLALGAREPVLFLRRLNLNTFWTG